jgi:hypothetical protein
MLISTKNINQTFIKYTEKNYLSIIINKFVKFGI